MRRSLFCLPLFPALLVAQTLENPAVRVQLRTDGTVAITDKKANASWLLPAPSLEGRPLEPVKLIPAAPGTLRFRAADVEFQLRLSDDEVEYALAQPPGEREIWLISKSLEIGPSERSYYAVPRRLGMLVYAEGEKPYTRRLRAYETGNGYSMAMLGVVRDGVALLASWEDAYTEIVLDYSPSPPRLTATLALRRSAQRVHLRPLGYGGYVEIAKAYREVARRRGFLKTLAEKLRENPKVERFFGAADFKPFAYMRRVANTRWNKTDKDIYDINFTFEECAALAEHFYRDLGLDRGLLVLNGWIYGGYDNFHPDILPAAPAIGGDAGLAECSRRVKASGTWLFGLHDNYQDMYRDAPSWDTSYLMKNPDGSPRQGGVWAGGQAWLICSRKAVELASRPQNVPGVVKQFAPDVYFSDTVFAAPLYECHDPAHPLTKNDDLHYKQELCRYIRRMVGLFGSEKGGEWGVPVADYFEGLMSHRTRFQNPDQTDIVIPLFHLVFADCIPIYAHQSDRPRPDNPSYILDHILYAEMPVYFFGRHRYWLDPEAHYQPPPDATDRLVFARGGRFNLIDQFIKNTYEVLSPLHRVTALMPMTDHRFLTPDRSVERTRFGDSVEITVNYGPKDYEMERATLPRWGFLIESPTLVAFHALRYGRLHYSVPTLLVIRSEDGRPLDSSRRVRIYRGFGERMVEFRGRPVDVQTERYLP